MNTRRVAWLVTLVGVLLVGAGVWHYFSVWSENAERKEQYTLYLAGRIREPSWESRQSMVKAKIAVDRARFEALALCGVGALGVAFGLWSRPGDGKRSIAG